MRPGGEVCALALTPASAALALMSALLLLTVWAGFRLRRRYRALTRVHDDWVRVFDSIEDLMLVHDQQGRVQKVNDALARRLKVHPRQVIGQSCDRVLPALEPEQGCPYCARHLSGISEGEDPCFGGRSVVSTSESLRGGQVAGTIHLIHPVTEQLLAEERYRQLCEGIREAVFISTPQGKIVDCNYAFVELLGYESRAQVLSMDAATLYSTRKERDALLKAIARQGFVRNYEFGIRRREGEVRTVQETSLATRNGKGEVVSYSGFLFDITDQKQTEEEIRRRNRELHVLNTIAEITSRSFDLDEILNLCLRHVIELHAAERGVAAVYDPVRKTLTARATFGLPEGAGYRELRVEDELVRHLGDRKVEAVNDEMLSALPLELQRFLGVRAGSANLCVVLWAQEQPAGLLAISSPGERIFTPRDKALMASVARQIGATVDKIRLYEQACRAYEGLRRTQEQLLQSEKMSAVGQLISGVAHELNNPLTAVLGYSQLLENEEMTPKARDFINKIFRQAQRTHRIVQSLLSFARQRKPQKQRVDVQRVLEDTLLLRDYDLKLNNIAVARDYEHRLAPSVGDPHQLEQVFLNIINNAVDAILETGRGGQLRVRAFHDGSNVCIEFHDSGPGLSDAKHIFDPFYTTKEVGKGTGLGLSICYGIVKEHGGEILAFNHPQHGGAVFQVRLPVAEAVAEAAPQTIVAESDRLILKGKCLLVDGEEPVLEFESEVLAGCGAEVTAVTDAGAAIDALQSSQYDLLLIGCQIPGEFGGANLVRWIGRHRPELLQRLVLTTSDLRSPNLRDCLAECEVPWLAKPFQVADLLRVCQQTLTAPKAQAAAV